MFDLMHPAVFVVMMVVMMVVMIMVVIMVVIMVMMVVVEVFVLLHAVHRNGDMGTRNTAFDGRLPRDGHAAKSDAVQLGKKFLRIGEKLQKGGSEHIACRAHGAVDVKCFHVTSPPCG